MSTTVLPLPRVLLVTFFILDESIVALSALKQVIALLASKAGLPLQYYHKIPEVFK